MDTKRTSLTPKQQQLMVAVWNREVGGEIATLNKTSETQVTRYGANGKTERVDAAAEKLERGNWIVKSFQSWSGGPDNRFVYQLTRKGAIEMQFFQINAPEAVQFGKDMGYWRLRVTRRYTSHQIDVLRGVAVGAAKFTPAGAVCYAEIVTGTIDRLMYNGSVVLREGTYYLTPFGQKVLDENNLYLPVDKSVPELIDLRAGRKGPELTLDADTPQVTSITVVGLQEAVKAIMSAKVEAMHPGAVKESEVAAIEDMANNAYWIWRNNDPAKAAAALRELRDAADWLASVIEAKS